VARRGEIKAKRLRDHVLGNFAGDAQELAGQLVVFNGERLDVRQDFLEALCLV
jgi:hypothetical protein